LKIPANEGWNRFVWDLRYPPATKLEGNDPITESVIAGPMVMPGTYQVTLDAGEQSLGESFDVVLEPGVTATQADLQQQFDLLMQIHQKTSDTITALNRMRDLRQQLGDWSKRVEGLPDGAAIAEAATALKEKV